MSAREVALQVLITCRREEGWVNEVLKKQLARSGLDARDAALATRLCYGVVQNRIRLDFYISQLLTGKAAACTRCFGMCCGWACIRSFIWIRSRYPLP